jgi:hypothetical protein
VYRVPTDQITTWGSMPVGAERVLAYPLAARVTCPYCALRCGFNLEGFIGEAQIVASAAIPCPCPNCGVEARFFVIDPTSEAGMAWQGELWLHPTPNERKALALEGVVPTRVLEAYQEVAAAFGYRLWRAAAQHARVALEGVVKTLLIDAGVDHPPPNLAQDLLLLAERHDLGAPIRSLGEALRAGGNLASHFDDRGDVTPELATEMLDLLDAFIEYFILLPNRVEAVMLSLEAAVSDIARDS